MHITHRAFAESMLGHARLILASRVSLAPIPILFSYIFNFNQIWSTHTVPPVVGLVPSSKRKVRIVLKRTFAVRTENLCICSGCLHALSKRRKNYVLLSPNHRIWFNNNGNMYNRHAWRASDTILEFIAAGKLPWHQMQPDAGSHQDISRAGRRPSEPKDADRLGGAMAIARAAFMYQST